MLITEVLTPLSYHPSNTERVVLSIVLVSDTPQLALAQVEQDPNRVYAADKLTDIGFLDRKDGGLTLTTSGEELARSQALSDDQGQPTDDATGLAASISDDT